MDIAEANDANMESMISIYLETIADCDMHENPTKRVHDFVTKLSTRNLGVDTDCSTDTTLKISKAWKA